MTATVNAAFVVCPEAFSFLPSQGDDHRYEVAVPQGHLVSCSALAISKFITNFKQGIHIFVLYLAPQTMQLVLDACVGWHLGFPSPRDTLEAASGPDTDKIL